MSKRHLSEPTSKRPCLTVRIPSPEDEYVQRRELEDARVEVIAAEVALEAARKKYDRLRTEFLAQAYCPTSPNYSPGSDDVGASGM